MSTKFKLKVRQIQNYINLYKLTFWSSLKHSGVFFPFFIFLYVYSMRLN